MIVHLTRFRQTTWRCLFCGFTSTNKAEICAPEALP
jgi:hypothetical protein